MGTLSTRTVKQFTSGKTSRKVFNSPWHADEPLRLYEQYPFAVGFSLQKIRQGNYNCLTVRRDSDSQERDIGFRDGLVDTAAIADFCGAGSGFVRRWYDPSPNSNHAVQTVAGLQPRIFNAGSLEVNEFGKPVIRFIDSTAAGIGQHLLFTPWHTASAAYIGFFAAYSLESAGFYPQLLSSTPLDQGLITTHFENTRQVRLGTNRSGGISIANGSALTLSQTYITHGCADRSRIKEFLDKSISATLDVADSNTNLNMPTSYCLGGLSFPGTVTSDTKVSSFVAYNTDVSASNLAIRSDLFDFWRS